MIFFRKLVLTFLLFFSSFSVFSQNWVDSIDVYGREVYMTAENYKWDWGQATFINSLIHLYNYKSAAQKEKYLAYIKTAMDHSFTVANGKHPNAVASGVGMAFLARITGDKKYREKLWKFIMITSVLPELPMGEYPIGLKPLSFGMIPFT